MTMFGRMESGQRSRNLESNVLCKHIDDEQMYSPELACQFQKVDHSRSHFVIRLVNPTRSMVLEAALDTDAFILTVVTNAG
jgi:hypothetical protein